MEFSDDGTSFTVGSSEMLQEATYTDPSELSSHHTVNERPEVEASVTQEPVVDEVEILTPLVATSDLGKRTTHCHVLILMIFFYIRV